MEFPLKKPLEKKYNIRNIDFKESFDQLCDEEKNYLYNLSKASWEGQLIVLFQTSYESPALFIIFQTYFKSFKSFQELNNIIINKAKLDPLIYKKFLEYVANFYANFGNYTLRKKKIVPEFPKSSISNNNNIDADIAANIKRFEEILNLAGTEEAKKIIMPIWDIIKYIVFDESDDTQRIDLEEREGKNSYYFGNLKKEEIESIDKYLTNNNISLLNTRLFKLNTKTVVLIGGAEEKQVDKNDVNLILLYGEFSAFIKKIINNLKEAKKFTQKPEEKELLDLYINFFFSGNYDYHFETQKKWLDSNNNPIIDYNMGWLETLVDPMGVRGIFESFVGLIDSFMSQKYEQIINLLPDLMLELPWKNEFNEISNNIYIKAFELTCFARKGCPYGKSLPNYQDIRKALGVKDLLFTNALPNFKEIEDNFFYYSNKEKELINNFGQTSIKITTCIRLILGYGLTKFLKHEKKYYKKEEFDQLVDSGEIIVDNLNTFKNVEIDGQKLIMEEGYNFEKKLINPLTGKEIEEWYKDNETYEQKFGNYANIVNDLISLLMGLYYCGNENIQEIFYINKIDFKNVTVTCWMLFLSDAVQDLNVYNTKEKIWNYSTSQCAWIIINFILSEQKESDEIIKFDVDKEKTSFKILLNKDYLVDNVTDILAKLLQNLYISKCIGNLDNVIKIIEKYSIIENESVLNVKNIIDKDEECKSFFLFHNLEKDANKEEKINYIDYPNNIEGVIQSYLDRYDEKDNKDVYNQWVKYATNFVKTS